MARHAGVCVSASPSIVGIKLQADRHVPSNCGSAGVNAVLFIRLSMQNKDAAHLPILVLRKSSAFLYASIYIPYSPRIFCHTTSSTGIPRALFCSVTLMRLSPG